MKSMFAVLLAVAGVVAATPVLADEALAKAKNCMTCHAVDKKLVGPSYKDVAAKYAGKGAEAQLADKIIKGGKGAWGEIPMPPNAAVSADEAKKLVAWVMKQK